MVEMNAGKEKLMKSLEAMRPRLIEISDFIHANPELGRQEFKASKLLEDELEQAGFTVERGAAGLPTAFVAEYAPNKGGPVIGIVAEYDALPEIGHGCGHNIIATTALGAALALKPMMDEIKGTLRVIGTPAEDTTSDKVIMIDKGIFDDVDFAFQVHPNDRTMGGMKFLALHKVDVIFHGVSSHASRAPEKGVSALDALLLTFNAVEFLREHVKKEVSIAYIVTAGGTAANSVPDYASAHFVIRSKDRIYLKEVVERVYNCARGAALATGATLELQPQVWLDDNLQVPTLDQLFEDNAMLGGAKQKAGQETMASSDFCNVTTRLPAARLDLAFAPLGTSTHSKGFAEAGNQEMAHDAVITGAFAMAATAYDLFTQPALAKQVKEEHAKLKG